MIHSKRRSFFHLVVPTIATFVAMGSCNAVAGHRGHRADCECQNTVPCDPCQDASGIPLAQPMPLYQQGEPVPAIGQPEAAPTSPSDGISDPVPQPIPDAGPQAASEPVPQAAPQPFDSGTTSDFNDFDLSTGLAGNFGGGGGTSLAFSESAVAPGYIESAKIQTRFRVRYDNMQGANAPARASFIYPTPGQLPGGGTGGPGLDYSSIAGTELDIQVVSAYAEFAMRDRFSIFVDMPIRWIAPFNNNAGLGPNDGDRHRGGGDISTGFRWGWIDCPDEHLTFQMRTTLPTGEPLRALGTGNTTMDIGLLYDQQLSSKSWFYAEINDWFTVDADTLTGPGAPADPSLLNTDANVLRLGSGLGYDVWNCSTRCQTKKLTLLFEVVSWVVLDGIDVPLNAVDAGDLVDATGDTIVNGKYGARYTHDRNSIYVGYGHNWTSDRWYSDLARIEWQRSF